MAARMSSGETTYLIVISGAERIRNRNGKAGADARDGAADAEAGATDSRTGVAGTSSVAGACAARARGGAGDSAAAVDGRTGTEADAANSSSAVVACADPTREGAADSLAVVESRTGTEVSTALAGARGSAAWGDGTGVDATGVDVTGAGATVGLRLLNILKSPFLIQILSHIHMMVMVLFLALMFCTFLYQN